MIGRRPNLTAAAGANTTTNDIAMRARDEIYKRSERIRFWNGEATHTRHRSPTHVIKSMCLHVVVGTILRRHRRRGATVVFSRHSDGPRGWKLHRARGADEDVSPRRLWSHAAALRIYCYCCYSHDRTYGYHDAFTICFHIFGVHVIIWLYYISGIRVKWSWSKITHPPTATARRMDAKGSCGNFFFNFSLLYIGRHCYSNLCGIKLFSCLTF